MAVGWGVVDLEAADMGHEGGATVEGRAVVRSVAAMEAASGRTTTRAIPVGERA